MATTNKRTFGRLATRDLRDHNHLLQITKAQATNVPRQMFWRTSQLLDQGDTPQCVAYAGKGWLIADPVLNNQKALTPEWLYRQCKKIDGYPDEDGTDIRSLYKVLKTNGFVSAYNWAYDVNTVAIYVATKGPMVMGTLWTERMMDTDRYGFIHVSGEEVGGHGWLVKGVNFDTKCPDGSVGAFRMVNSWGRSWGQNGCASISFKDMAILLREDGEACTATELRVPKWPV